VRQSLSQEQQLTFVEVADIIPDETYSLSPDDIVKLKFWMVVPNGSEIR